MGFSKQVIPHSLYTFFGILMGLGNKQNATDTVYLDFSKAFNNISHDIIVARSIKCGLDNAAVRWTVAGYCQRVLTNDFLKRWALTAGSAVWCHSFLGQTADPWFGNPPPSSSYPVGCSSQPSLLWVLLLSGCPPEGAGDQTADQLFGQETNSTKLLNQQFMPISRFL